MKRNRFALAAALLAVVAAGCSDGAERALTSPDGAAPRLTVTSVQVCCTNTLYKGSSYQVSVNVLDEYGFPISNPSVTWSPVGDGVISVAGSGSYATVYAVNPGLSTVYATVGGVTGSATVTVLAPPTVNSVTVTPTPTTVGLGLSKSLTARAYDQYGNQLSGLTPTWSTANSSVATVSAGGVVTGVALGTTTITATIGGKSATATVTVANQLSVSISGPSTVFSAGGYDWTASATGGSGSYTYRWWVDYGGSQQYEQGTDATTGLYIGEYDPTFIALIVEVTSGTQTATASIGVCNFIASAAC